MPTRLAVSADVSAGARYHRSRDEGHTNQRYHRLDYESRGTMKLGTKIRQQIEQGPDGEVEVLACYGGVGLLLCRIGRHDEAGFVAMSDGWKIYKQVCARCGKVITHIRLEGMEE